MRTKYRIALFQGKGSDIIGGGAILEEYNLWANTQPDIEIDNYIYNPDIQKFDVAYTIEKTICDRKLKNVYEYNPYSTKIDSILDMNYTHFIILTFPESDDKYVASWYANLIYRFKGFTGVLCYDYNKDVVLNNIGAKYKDLYNICDKIWVNNKNNPLVEHLKDYVDINKFHFECPQFMAEHKPDWLPIKDKYLKQLYYQGRDLDWKGFKELTTLKDKLFEYTNSKYNVAFNGVTYNKHLLKKENTHFNALYEKGFNKRILKNNEYYGLFSPKTAKELTQKAGFSLYYTTLPLELNFFPEYAFIDAIRNGTIVILPHHYFYDKNNPIFKHSPEQAGMLIWDHTSKESTIQLNYKIEELINNNELYNIYRERAYKYVTTYFSADYKIRKFLDLI